MSLLNLFGNSKEKDELNQIDLKEITPQPLVDSEVNQKGKVTLLRPRFKNEYILKILSPFLKSKFFKIHLDEIGSLVWKNLDGQTTGKEISLILQEKSREDEFEEEDWEKLNQRLAMFLYSLKRNNFIAFEHKKNENK